MAYWLYPANTKFYDVMGAMKESETYWPVKSKVEKGDMLFIYLTAPYKQITYICEIIDTGYDEKEVIHFLEPFFINTGNCDKKTSVFMKLKPLQTLSLSPDSLFSLHPLRENGLKGMLMGPRKLDNCPPLLDYVKGALEE